MPVAAECNAGKKQLNQKQAKRLHDLIQTFIFLFTKELATGYKTRFGHSLVVLCDDKIGTYDKH